MGWRSWRPRNTSLQPERRRSVHPPRIGYFGPTFGGVLSALETPNGYYESAINNIFATNVSTGRIYTTFSGITVTGGNPLTLPTIFQRSEDALPGWTLVEQVFICGNVMFCDNYITGGGTLLGVDAFVNGQLRTDFLTLIPSP